MRFSRYCQKSMFGTCFEVFKSKVMQNGPKMRFFKFSEKSMQQTFLIFRWKFQRHIDLKLTNMTLGKIFFFFRVLGQTGPEMGPIWCLLGIIQNQCVEHFWFFAWNYSRIKAEILVFWGKGSMICFLFFRNSSMKV